MEPEYSVRLYLTEHRAMKTYGGVEIQLTHS